MITDAHLATLATGVAALLFGACALETAPDDPGGTPSSSGQIDDSHSDEHSPDSEKVDDFNNGDDSSRSVESDDGQEASAREGEPSIDTVATPERSGAKRTLDHSCADNKSELLSKLNRADRGDTVCVATDAEIDMTGETDVVIPGGVTLRGDRERTGNGPLIYTDQYDTKPLFLIKSDDVRVTGIRLRGPDQKRRNDAYVTPNSRGISVRYADDVEIDHSELFGWTHAAVYLVDSSDVHIHHNDIHHNQRYGLGYGVVHYGDATSLVEHNIFDFNRHSLSGSGDRGQGYTARRNIFLSHANSSILDMHGEIEDTNRDSPYAGREIEIRRNTVLADHVASVMIRGRPERGGWVEDNCLGRGRSNAVVQRNFSGNLHISNNEYSTTDPDCTSMRGWYVSPGGAGFRKHYVWSSATAGGLLFGDFDGDGRADALRLSSGGWMISSGADSSWSQINSADISSDDEFAVGDIDGDGEDDVLRSTPDNNHWFVSRGATSDWEKINYSYKEFSELALADFNGDGEDDIFMTTGSKWRVSYSGTTLWQTLRSAHETIEELAFGDFDGDGEADVLYPDGSTWHVVWGGTSSWDTLNSSSYGLDRLHLADLDGDGETDIVLPTGSSLKVSWSGQTTWSRRATYPYEPDEVEFADFTGDGADDAFHATGN